MKTYAAGVARKLILALSLCLLLAAVGCSGGGSLVGPSGASHHSSVAPTRLLRTSLNRQVSGAPAGLLVTWLYVDDPLVQGYYLYRDTQSIPDPGPDGFIDPSLRVNGGNVIPQPGAGPEVNFSDLFSAQVGTTYYYRVTVVDVDDQESYPSNELSWTVHGHNVATIDPTSAYYGDVVTITGDTFGTYDNATDKVLFEALAGGQIEGSVNNWADTEIEAVVPVGAKTGPVTVAIENTIAQSDEDLVILNPILQSLDPDRQFAGDSVTIHGLNFGAIQDASILELGAVDLSSSVTAWADDSISFDVPADAVAGPLSITVQGVKSNELPFLVLPHADSVDITRPQTGEVITVSGNHFGDTAGKVFLDGSAEQAVGNWADAELTFTLDVAAIGAHSITVQTADSLDSNELALDVVSPLTITVAGLTPSNLYRVSDTPSLTLTGSTADDAEQVDLLVDGNVVASSSTAPFDDLLLALNKLNNGAHLVKMTSKRRAISVESVELPFEVYSLVGDIDGSGVVDADDRDILLSLIGTVSTDSAYRPWMDPFEDGIVNEADLVGVGYNFGNLLP